MTAPVIFVRAGGGGYLVAVEPAPDGFVLPDPFVDQKSARGFAGGLRLVHRWRLVDETGEGAQ